MTPIYNLESYIDASALNIADIDVGIAKCFSKGMMEPAYYGGTYEWKKFNCISIDQLTIDESSKQKYSLLADDKIAWKYFLKLQHNLYVGSYVISLRSPTGSFELEASNNDTPAYDLFPSIKEFANQLKTDGHLTQVGKISIFVVENDSTGVEHVDHNKLDFYNLPDIDTLGTPAEFLWFNPKRDKKFYVRDKQGKKHYASSAIWFNSFSRHGTDSSMNTSWSIRIDGKFSKELSNFLGAQNVMV